MPGGLFSVAKLFGMTIRESANDGSDFTNPDADFRRLFLGEDGQLHVKDSAGVVTDIGTGIAATIVDAKGDIIAATAADTVARKAVGANGTHLAADSGQSTGLAWQGTAWADYTPTLTAVTTNPTLGNSTLTGRWRSLGAKTVAVAIRLQVDTGGGWNAGSGEWKFSLPSVTSGGHVMIGMAQVLDAGVGYFAGSCQIASGATVVWPIVISDDTGNRIMAHNKPVTWATGDNVHLFCLIEITTEP